VIAQACNHCPFVQAWEGRIDSVSRDYAERGVQVVVINSNDAERQPEDSYEAMKARVASEGLSYPYLHDADQALARALGAERTPEVFVFDDTRRLVYHGAVDDNRDEMAVTVSYLRDALDAVLSGEPVQIAGTDAVGCTIKWREAA
jgi:DNA-binding LacI/PurR family transcriptional regulator